MADTLLSRIERILEASSRPLFAAEVARIIGHGYDQVSDAMGRMYRLGILAKSAPRRNARALWTTVAKVGTLPPSAVPMLHAPAPRPGPRPEPPRPPVSIDARAIARNRSVFDWGGE